MSNYYENNVEKQPSKETKCVNYKAIRNWHLLSKELNGRWNKAVILELVDLFEYWILTYQGFVNNQ